MIEKDLEETKPIKKLSDLVDSRSDRYDMDNQEVTRSEKYEDVLIDDEIRNREEEAREELIGKSDSVDNDASLEDAVKIVPVTEESLKKEQKKKENLDDDDDEITEDDGLLGKLIVKWRSLSKKKKRLIIVGTIIGLFVLIALIIFLILVLTGKEDEKPVVKQEEVKEEVIPVIVDNFYYKEGKLYFLKEDNSELGSYECTNKDDKLCYVDVNLVSDSFDVARLESSDGSAKNQRLPIYEDNYAFVFDNKEEKGNEIILYSIKDEKEIARYLDVKAYSDNYVIVKDQDEKYGLIQIQNGVTEVIKPQYKYLGMIDGEANLIAKNDKGYYVINKKNKVLSSKFDSSFKVKYYNSNYVVIEKNDEYSIYDYKGNLIDGGYDFATVVDKYIALVSNNTLYIKDGEKTKYTEVGIKLSNKNYVKTYVYDENDQLVETKRSFEFNIKDNEIEVVVYSSSGKDPKHTQLNINEALVNKKYEYVNYFNGKLYFYSDVEKESLIGTYSCDNHNLVKSSEDEYNTCFIANDTILEDNDMVSSGELTRKSRTPIINKRYVFINDGTTNIALYNLVDKNTEVNYLKVNTYTPNNDYKVTHYSGTLDVVVQTKSGKYGVIVFNEENVNSKHSFKYTSLEKLGDYYVGLDSSNYWRILYNGSESAGFSNKVRGYNKNKEYFKVVENGKYYIYNDSAEKVVDTEYVYVELYGTYYAAVNGSNEVNLYDYSGNKINVHTVTVGNYKYYGTDNPAFKVKKDGEDYIVSVWDGTQYNDTNVTLVKVENSEDDKLDSDLSDESVLD